MANRVAAGALSLGLAVGAAACSRGGGKDDAPAKKPRDVSQVCVITEVPRRDMLGHATFTDLLDRPATDRDLVGTAAAIALLRSRYDADLGPYEPVIDHLVSVYQEVEEEKRPVPKVTAEARHSAERLDRDLAHGLCK